jgi:hypothetical protein
VLGDLSITASIFRDITKNVITTFKLLFFPESGYLKLTMCANRCDTQYRMKVNIVYLLSYFIHFIQQQQQHSENVLSGVACHHVDMALYRIANFTFASGILAEFILEDGFPTSEMGNSSKTRNWSRYKFG